VFESVLLYYLYRICKYLCIEFSCSLIGRCFFWTEHFATVTCILVRLYCSVISIMWFSSETLPMVWKNKSISWLRIVTKVVWLCYLVFSVEYFVALLWIFSMFCCYYLHLCGVYQLSEWLWRPPVIWSISGRLPMVYLFAGCIQSINQSVNQ